MRLFILSVAVFLSGISALIFQTLWLRLSGLAFGNSVWSAALILSSFMAGLALGGMIAAFSKRQRWRPLRLYASLEIAVALFGCTLVFALPLLGLWMRPCFQLLWSHEALLNAVRFFVSFLILLVPTTAMGLTMPVLVNDPIVASHDFPRVIGLIYGFNTLGAVVGAMASEAYLIEAFGLFGTALAAGGLNCIAAAVALLAAATMRPALSSERKAEAATTIDSSASGRLLCVSFGLGTIFLSLEVIWFRFLRLYIASSSTAFSIMLVVVLAGIGFGGVFAGVIQRCARTRLIISTLLVVAALVTLLTYIFFPAPPVQQTLGSSYIESWKTIGLLSFALMFPVAVLSGILFPIIVSRVQANVTNRTNSTGLTTLFNTAGAALGPLLAGFILLPSVGFQTSLLICAGCYALLAIVPFDRSAWSFRSAPGLLLIALYCALALLFAIFPYRRDANHFAHARQPFEADGSHFIKRMEGNSDSFQLLQRELLGEPYYYRLLTNAYSMSGTMPQSQRYMRLFAYIPLALRPESKDALVIGYGVGVTADAFTRESPLNRIDVVDISKEVFKLAPLYTGFFYSNPLADSRVRTFIQDGRFFLQTSQQQYDIITGEPPPLRVAGTVNLYTEEFFSLVKARLKENGITTFWLPIYQVKLEQTKAILRAFHDVFPNSSLWSSSDLEWIMVGINGAGRKLTDAEIGALWSDNATRTDLVRLGVENPEQMAALFLMEGEEIERITRDTKPLTDFYPKRITDATPDFDNVYRFALSYENGSAAAQRFFSSSMMSSIWPTSVKSSAELFFMVRETRFRSQIIESNWLAELDLYLRHSPLRTPVLEVLNSDAFRVEIARRRSRDQKHFSAEGQMADLIAGALADRDVKGAIQLLEQEKSRGFADTKNAFLLIYLYCLDGRVGDAEALANAQILPTTNTSFADWLWKELQAQFGFRPPR